MAVLLLSRVQLRETAPLLGSGQEMAGTVAAAKWVARNADSGRVLSDMPRLLRFYAPTAPPERFLSFRDIAGEAWPAILAELHERGVRFIVWHDQIYAEHGHPQYAPRYDLQRFDRLGEAGEGVAGVALRWQYRGSPNVWVHELVTPGPSSATPPADSRYNPGSLEPTEEKMNGPDG
jgi:hypothetical protein